MFVAFLVLAASASADPRASLERTRRILLAVNEEATSPAEKAEARAPAGDSKIEHAPLLTTPRNETVVIQAKVLDTSRLFAPLVFARKSGIARYEAFTMRDRGPGRAFQARLPSSILSEGSFEYFIEAQHEQGPATRLGSPRNPLICVAFDPPPQPVALTIRTAEPGAAVRIDDNDAGRTPITVRLLPGPHTLSVTGVDGRSTEQQIDLKPSKKLDLAVALPKDAGGPATLSIHSDPPGANVLVDDALVGRTPYQGELRPGQHTIAVEAEGRLREERKVFAREGRDASFSFALAPLPRTAAVAVDSEPVGARVLVDGKERGRTPLVAALPPGRHQLLLQLEGRRDVGTEFDMPKDRDLWIRLDLPIADRSASRLTVSSAPNGAVLFVDGVEVGLTPWSGPAKPGFHTVAVQTPGFVKDERTVQVQPYRDTDLAFALNRAPGPARLHVETEPPAQVRVDSQELGLSPLTIEVPPGEHEVQVALEGHRTVAQQLTLDPGQGLSVRIPMHRSQAHDAPLIAVATDPAGAQVFLDQKLVGATPLKIRSTTGPHEVKLSLDGYISRVARPILPTDRDFELRIAVVLKPVRGAAEKQRAPTVAELADAQVAAAHACYVKGDLECALSGYRAAYQYRSNPRILFNIAQMRRKLGRYEEAAGTYREFLGLADKQRAGATQKEMIAEARLQLANCENQLMPRLAAAPAAVAAEAAAVPAAVAPAAEAVAAAPEVEDSTPPRLAHEALRSGTRGRPLRLVATVTDDRSGVGSVQACWRNAYGRDFECHSMGNTGGDEYGIDVPARTVTDGFAYYLEAWDNTENGPARSGAPELPHAIILDEPAPVSVSPGVGVQPPETGDVVAARFNPVPTPPLVIVDRKLPAHLAPAARQADDWTLTALLGGERSNEQSYTDSTLVGRIGIDATRRFGESWFFELSADWRSSSQQYVPFNATRGAKVNVVENRFDFAGWAGYDFGELLDAGGRLELVPLAGAAVVTARNDGFAFDIVGAGGGLRASWAFAPFTVRALATYTYNLNKSSSANSAFGVPVSAFSGRAGLGMRIAAAYSVELDYIADAIQFDQVRRVAHGAVLGFSKSF
ncbi:MAG TPA: PEGA domain-containing protein [Myxococcales bacterium]